MHQKHVTNERLVSITESSVGEQHTLLCHNPFSQSTRSTRIENALCVFQLTRDLGPITIAQNSNPITLSPACVAVHSPTNPMSQLRALTHHSRTTAAVEKAADISRLLHVFGSSWWGSSLVERVLALQGFICNVLQKALLRRSGPTTTPAF